MTEHNLFYYPYASFTNAQAPLLKVAAIYFDKIYILDPEKANSGSIGIGNVASDVDLLEREGKCRDTNPISPSSYVLDAWFQVHGSAFVILS